MFPGHVVQEGRPGKQEGEVGGQRPEVGAVIRCSGRKFCSPVAGELLAAEHAGVTEAAVFPLRLLLV